MVNPETTATPTKGPSWRKLAVLSAVIGFLIVLDQVTKHWVHTRFRLGESIPIWSDYFNLTYIRNTGAAFGFLAQADPAFRVPFFIAVPIAALIAILYVFRKLPAEDWRLSSALAMLVGGAVGNLIDRVRLGFVIDFLDFHWRYQAHFPAFNVADMAICVGVGILMLDFVIHPETGDKAEKDEASHVSPPV
jgi:signal peptidase II